MAQTAEKPMDTRTHMIDADDPHTGAATRKLTLDRVRFGEPLRPLAALRRLLRFGS